MPRAMLVSDAARKPLLGFGPIGWAGLPIAGCLAWAAMRGADILTPCMSIIYYTLGYRALLWVLILQGSHWLSWTRPGMGLIQLSYTLIAIHVWPGRVGLLRTAVAIVWAVARPLPEVFYAAPLAENMWSIEAGIWIATTDRVVFDGLIGGVLLWWLTGRWWIGVVTLGATACAVATSVLAWHGVHMGFPTRLLYRYGWHVAVGGSLLWWAISGRVQAVRAQRFGRCGACGYDLRGLSQPVCPECGEKQEEPAIGAKASRSSHDESHTTDFGAVGCDPGCGGARNARPCAHA